MGKGEGGGRGKGEGGRGKEKERIEVGVSYERRISWCLRKRKREGSLVRVFYLIGRLRG